MMCGGIESVSATRTGLAFLQSICTPDYLANRNQRLDYTSEKRFNDVATFGATWFSRHADRAAYLNEPVKSRVFRVLSYTNIMGLYIGWLPTRLCIPVQQLRSTSSMSDERRQVRGVHVATQAIVTGLEAGFRRVDISRSASFLVLERGHSRSDKLAEIEAVEAELASWLKPTDDEHRRLYAHTSVQRQIRRIKSTCDLKRRQLYGIERRQEHLRRVARELFAPDQGNSEAPAPHANSPQKAAGL